MRFLFRQSEMMNEEIGIPHGSISGPIFFSIYINDIFYHFLSQKYVVCADVISTEKKNKLTLTGEIEQRITISVNSRNSTPKSVMLLCQTIHDKLQ